MFVSSARLDLLGHNVQSLRLTPDLQYLEPVFSKAYHAKYLELVISKAYHANPGLVLKCAESKL